jgi:hypothetical protein
MIHVNEKYQASALPSSLSGDIQPARRLIVPILTSDADITGITQKVWELANSTQSDIKFIGICNDSTQESSLRRTLATMSAMVNYDSVSSETKIIYDRDWLNSIKNQLQTGDMVVYWEEQNAGFRRRSLSPLLRADLGVPLYLLEGLASHNKSRSTWATQAGIWLGFLVIIIGFFFIQGKIYQLANNWTVILELCCTVTELWLIWFWNHLFV